MLTCANCLCLHYKCELYFEICLSDLLGEDECQHVYSTVHKKKKEVVDEPSYMNTDTMRPEPYFYDETTQDY